MATDFLYHRVWFDISQMRNVMLEDMPAKVPEQNHPVLHTRTMEHMELMGMVWYGNVAYFVSVKVHCCLYREVFIDQGTPKWMVDT